jgi:hypothetical protein
MVLSFDHSILKAHLPTFSTNLDYFSHKKVIPFYIACERFAAMNRSRLRGCRAAAAVFDVAASMPPFPSFADSLCSVFLLDAAEVCTEFAANDCAGLTFRGCHAPISANCAVSATVCLRQSIV